MKNHLFWIVPLCLCIGWTIGFYVGIPKHITLDYGDNVVELSKTLRELYNRTQCPDCNCGMNISDYGWYSNSYYNYSLNISDYGGWYSKCRTCWDYKSFEKCDCIYPIECEGYEK